MFIITQNMQQVISRHRPERRFEAQDSWNITAGVLGKPEKLPLEHGHGEIVPYRELLCCFVDARSVFYIALDFLSLSSSCGRRSMWQDSLPG